MPTPAIAGETAAGLQTKLDAMMVAPAWTVADSTPGDALGTATADTVTLSLSNTAQRLNGGVNKNVAVAIIQLNSAFATTRLNGPASGYVVTGARPDESLSSVFQAVGSSAAGDVAYVDFFYTDGTTELAVPTAALNGGGAASTTNVRTALNALLTTAGTFTVNDSNFNGGTANLDAGERYMVSVSSNAARGGKTIGLLRINATATGAAPNAFAAAKLNSATGWVIPSEYKQVQYDLNNQLGTGGGQFTVTETPATGAGKTVGVFNSGDIVTLGLGALPVTPAGTGILSAFIPQGAAGTGFATNALNAPAAGFTIYPGTAFAATADLYKPGDNVIVTVDSTVLDPAGNSIDTGSNNNTSSANAS